jgi:hypothetical protein
MYHKKICRLDTGLQGKKITQNEQKLTFKSVINLTYIKWTLTYQNWMQEQIKRELNSGNACFHSLIHILYSCLLCQDIKMKYTEIKCSISFSTGINFGLAG